MQAHVLFFAGPTYNHEERKQMAEQAEQDALEVTPSAATNACTHVNMDLSPLCPHLRSRRTCCQPMRDWDCAAGEEADS